MSKKSVSRKDVAGSAAAAASFNHEQAARVRARQLILQYSGALMEATKDEIRWLKQTNVLGLRAPKSSLMSAHHLLQLLREHEKGEVADQLQTTIVKFLAAKKGAKPQAAQTMDDGNDETQELDDELAEETEDDPTAEAAAAEGEEEQRMAASDDDEEAKAKEHAHEQAEEDEDYSAQRNRRRSSSHSALKRKSAAASADRGRDPLDDERHAESSAARSKRSRKSKVQSPSSSYDAGFDSMPPNANGESASFSRVGGMGLLHSPESEATARSRHVRRRSSIREQDAAAAAAASQRDLLTTLAFAEFAPNPRDEESPAATAAAAGAPIPLSSSPPAVHFGSDHSRGVRVAGDNRCIVVGPSEGFGSVRASHGITAGSWYIEVRGVAPTDLQAEEEATEAGAAAASAAASSASASAASAPTCRIGFATLAASLDSKLGSDAHAYAYSERYGEKIHAGLKVAYGAPFSMQPLRQGQQTRTRSHTAAAATEAAAAATNLHLSSPLSPSFPVRRGDVIGLLIQLDSPAGTLDGELVSSPPRPPCNRLSFYKNGVLQGVAYADLPVGQCWYPAATVSHGAALRFDFRAAENLKMKTTPQHRAAAAHVNRNMQHNAHLASSLLLPGSAAGPLDLLPLPHAAAAAAAAAASSPSPSSRVLFHASPVHAPVSNGVAPHGSLLPSSPPSLHPSSESSSSLLSSSSSSPIAAALAFPSGSPPLPSASAWMLPSPPAPSAASLLALSAFAPASSSSSEVVPASATAASDGVCVFPSSLSLSAACSPLPPSPPPLSSAAAALRAHNPYSGSAASSPTNAHAQMEDGAS